MVRDVSSIKVFSNSYYLIIIEVQKSPIKSPSDLKKSVDSFFAKGEKTLLLTVINKNNQRRYLGVKIN